jgi:hypothetical protein
MKLLSLESSVKDSLIGRIDQLKTESVSKAIRRVIKEKLPDDQSSLQIIEEAEFYTKGQRMLTFNKKAKRWRV